MFENLYRVMTSPQDQPKLVRRRCGHEATWSREDAFFVFGEDAAPYDVWRRVKYGACGEKGQIAISI